VPVSEAEAVHIAAIVDAMPEPRREILIDRFRGARERSGSVLDPVRGEAGEERIAAIASAASAYFQLGIPCPFLEDDACTIYENRPAVCREYLVTSAPEHCATLDLERTERVPVPVPVSSTLIYFSGTEPAAMPLIDALNSRETVAEGLPGDVLFRRFLQLFSESPARANPPA
jgi:hypothetical protein